MKKLLTGSLLALAPLGVFAQTNAFTILGVISNIANILIPLLITVALIVFVWGVIKYISAKDGDAKADGRKFMVNGLLGLFVILSVWGLIGIVQSTFGVGSGGSLGPENIPTVGR